MAYTAAHGKLTILGDAYTGAEEWQTGVRLIGTTPPTTAEFQALDTAVAAFLGTTALGFPNGFRYIGLKWAPQGTDGKYGPDGEALEFFRTTPYTASVGSAGYPQLALVTSLRTARARGYASNGRMYWPSAAPTSASDGRLGAGGATAVATACATLLGSAAMRAVGTPAVMSAVGAGRTEVVTGVRVGRVMDTMRSRRNQLAEEYVPVVNLPS